MLRLPRKLQLLLWTRRKSTAPATQNDFRHVIKQVGMSQSAAPATQNDMTTCLETFEKERFCSFPDKQTRRGHMKPQENHDLRWDTWEHQNEHFVRDFLQCSHFVASKSTFSYEFSWEPLNLLPQNRCFVRISQNATPATEFAPCRHLTQPWHAIRKKHATRHVSSAAPATQNDDGHVQSAAPARKTATHLLKKSQKYCACQKMTFDSRHVTKHVWISRIATPAMRNEATRHVQTPKVPPFAELT